MKKKIIFNYMNLFPNTVALPCYPLGFCRKLCWVYLFDIVFSLQSGPEGFLSKSSQAVAQWEEFKPINLKDVSSLKLLTTSPSTPREYNGGNMGFFFATGFYNSRIDSVLICVVVQSYQFPV